MKKYVLSFITLFAMCLAFSLTSCGDDEEEGGGGEVSSSKLLGKWVFVKKEGYTIYNGKKEYFEHTYKISDEYGIYIFKKNGTFREYGYYIDKYGDKVKEFDNTGEWIQEQNTLYLNYSDGDEYSAKIKETTDSQLILVNESKTSYEEMIYQKVD